jgi:hypothetical protein
MLSLDVGLFKELKECEEKMNFSREELHKDVEVMLGVWDK